MIEILKEHRWILDTLDITLMSLILYRLLLIVIGTKAAQMMIGLGILLLASLASTYLELFTIDWLVQSFWAQIVIVVIVVFQPEIRRALAHIGEAQFLNFASAEGLKSLEEIVRAAVSMANRKIGARKAQDRPDGQGVRPARAVPAPQGGSAAAQPDRLPGMGHEFRLRHNVIDVAVRRLRAKVDDGFEFKLIHTVRGMGYVLEETTP